LLPIGRWNENILQKKRILMQYDHHYEYCYLDATITIVCEKHGYLCSVLDNLSSV
jgi:hypothetical protein